MLPFRLICDNIEMTTLDVDHILISSVSNMNSSELEREINDFQQSLDVVDFSDAHTILSSGEFDDDCISLYKFTDSETYQVFRRMSEEYEMNKQPVVDIISNNHIEKKNSHLGVVLE